MNLQIDFNSYYEFTVNKLNNYTNKLFYKNEGKIYMLHRVLKKNTQNLKNFENMSIDPITLKNKLLKDIKDGYVFITITEFYDIILYKKIPNYKFIILTIDDGYKDTFTNFFPIVKELNIPFTFYVSSSFPNKKIALWWNYLNDVLIGKIENKKLTNNINKINRNNIYIEYSKKLLRLGSTINDNFEDILNISFTDLNILYKNDFIEWDDILIMSQNDLCTIGAHTDMHYGLKFTDLNIIEIDIQKNISEIQHYLNITPEHFAYPYGSYFSVGNREFNLLSKMNFKTAVCTYNADIFKSDFKKLFSLPRIVLNND